MNKFEKSFEMKSGLIVNIKRIILDESIRMRHKLIPIKNTAFWVVDLEKRYEFFLPQLYAALTCLTGPGDVWYDNYKGSYSLLKILILTFYFLVISKINISLSNTMINLFI